jgi:hypothetical protein
MAYDRFDRDERSRWSDDRSDDRSGRDFRGDHRGRDERGFWDRASDEVSSWFGDEEAERRRRQDQMRDERDGDFSGSSRDSRRSDRSAFGRGSGAGSERDYDRGYGRDYDRDRASFRSEERERERDQNRDRGVFNRGGSSDRDYNRDWRGDFSSDRNRERGYRPLAGDYGRSDHESEQFFAASGYGRGEPPLGGSRRDYESRRTSFAGSRDREFDPHYHSWRDRHMSELDRDYDDFRREHQSKFENDFTSWREKRQHKRGLLGQIREHMEVVGSDDKHVGTVDKAAGDRIILTKSDPESGGVHHSLSCSDIDRIEGDKVILDCKAEEAQHRWRDESRDRALFERDDQGEMGPRNLDRSFSGTYR